MTSREPEQVEHVPTLIRYELDAMEERITEDAYRLAKENGRIKPGVVELAAAYRRHVLGSEPVVSMPSLWARFSSSISGITLVSALLAITFGVLGYLAAKGTEGAGVDAGALYDIAKIFAGAVVGSTGAGAAAVATRSKGG